MEITVKDFMNEMKNKEQTEHSLPFEEDTLLTLYKYVEELERVLNNYKDTSDLYKHSSHENKIFIDMLLKLTDTSSKEDDVNEMHAKIYYKDYDKEMTILEQIFDDTYGVLLYTRDLIDNLYYNGCENYEYCDANWFIDELYNQIFNPYYEKTYNQVDYITEINDTNLKGIKEYVKIIKEKKYINSNGLEFETYEEAYKAECESFFNKIINNKDNEFFNNPIGYDGFEVFTFKNKEELEMYLHGCDDQFFKITQEQADSIKEFPCKFIYHRNDEFLHIEDHKWTYTEEEFMDMIDSFRNEALKALRKD